MRNEKLENFKEKMNGKNVAIIGMGVSNKPLLKYLYDLKCNITVFDKREEEKIDSDIFETIRELNIKVAAQDSIIFNQLGIISNKDHIILEYKNKHDELIANNLKQIKKEQRKSRIFKIFSASELAIIAILACFL